VQKDWFTQARGRLTSVFGTPQGAWLIRRVIRPLDYLLYRASGGRVVFLNAFLPTLMLTTTGAKSGQPRTVPLLYLRDGRRIVLIASNYGGASHPAWYRNLLANPVCSVNLGGRELRYVAREAEGAEREELWRRAVALYGGYRTYQERAGERRVPVMVLEPAG
jgi:deazaflavin-dependent oxidoreductase (nitroreductase family)